MRAGGNEATGASGESEVQAQFERLQWAALLDSRHDVGTDLYLRPRDLRRFELGVVMGAQVKTGPKYFKQPVFDDSGELEGWWFYDHGHEHWNYWLNHALPHIVVLRDQTSDLSHWAHVTPEGVQFTPAGAKLFVPYQQTIDAQHIDALTAVALTQLPSYSWDGTAWTGLAHVVPDDELRHALLAPRVIAPHANALPEKLSGTQALAMQMLLRPEIERLFHLPKGLAGRTWEKRAAV